MGWLVAEVDGERDSNMAPDEIKEDALIMREWVSRECKM